MYLIYKFIIIQIEMKLIFYKFDKLFILKIKAKLMGIGDWGLGIGDWGLGAIPNPKSPIPNPHNIKIYK